jgi:uncharacterized protein YmfQ (DUF2313 family)
MATLEVDALTAALWRFDESQASYLPNDAAGGIAPLGPVVAGQIPTVVPGQLGNGMGFARQFAAGFGFKGAELVADRLRLRRSLTLEAVLQYTQNGGRQTIVCRGTKDGTAAQRRLFCLSLIRSGGVDKVSLEWDRTSGTAAVVGDITFTPPAGWFYLAVVREWTSTVLATVRAYVGQMVGERPVFALVGTQTSTEADIEDGAAGETDVGIRWGGAAYDSHYAGPLDQVRVSSDVRSAEELEHTFRTQFFYPGLAYELVTQALPPGVGYSTDPTSRIQRWLQVLAEGVGIAWGKARELADYYQPDVAWSLLSRWEQITRLSPRPGDTIQQRRDRVVGFLRRIHGYNRDSIRNAVFELLNTTVANVVVVENSNMFTDPFDGSTPKPWWTIEANNGTAVVTAGLLALQSQAGDDARWNATVAVPVRLRTTLAADTEAEVIASVQPSLTDNGASCGLYVYNFVNGNAHLFGIQRDAGSNKWWHRKIEGGVVTSTLGAATGAGTTFWLRYKRKADGNVDLQFRVDGSGFDGPWSTAFAGVATIASQWTGPFVVVDTNPAVSINGGDFLDFRMWCPRSREVFQAYLYRDPLLAPTNYDRVGAQLVVDKMKPAHVNVTVIEALDALTDSPFTRVDGEPLGA